MRILLVLIFCHCCFPFLLVVSNSACASTSTCAKLGNLPFPFGADPSCGDSSSFVLSNCTTEQAYWNNFDEAISNGDDPLDPPAVMGIYSSDSIRYINLTWKKDFDKIVNCPPAPSKEISQYLPKSINLTGFANSAFEVSQNNIYLLFGCTNHTSLPQFGQVEENSQACESYQADCPLPKADCIQLKPKKELKLQYVMENWDCKQFMFFVTSFNASVAVQEWRAAMVQLYWNYDNATCYGSLCSTASKIGNDCHGRRLCSTGSKIAVGVSVSVGSIAILAVLSLYYHHRRRKLSTKSVPTSSSNKFWTERALSLSTQFGPVSTKEFSFEELLQATESFADKNMIGDGGFGAVYVGFLRDGRKVAIKRLYHDNFRRMEHFYNEMKILSTLQHPNLVKLYGFCCQDERDLLLVFQYASNGTVSDQLHDVTKPAMPWKVRLNIAWETAEALSYLHNSMSPPIFHRDVKTTNILLDEKFHAKLADFGLSRLVPLEVSHVSTAPQGTPGYLDPDYHQCYQLTDKSDVYSFGVVLMELVSAMLAVDISRNRREINLASLALMKIACGAWEELVDPRLEMDKNPDMETRVKCVVDLAFECLHPEKDDRPNMSLVAETLANIRRESGYGYEEIINAQYSKVDIRVPSPADETSQLIKPKSAFNFAYSPNSVHSCNWTSSYTSLDMRSL